MQYELLRRIEGTSRYKGSIQVEPKLEGKDEDYFFLVDNNIE